MVRIDAGLNVAFVKHAYAFGNFAVVYYPRKSMRANPLTFMSYASIAVAFATAIPKPTTRFRVFRMTNIEPLLQADASAKFRFQRLISFSMTWLQ